MLSQGPGIFIFRHATLCYSEEINRKPAGVCKSSEVSSSVSFVLNGTKVKVLQLICKNVITGDCCCNFVFMMQN